MYSHQLKIRLKSYNLSLLKASISHIKSLLGVEVVETSVPTRIRRWTVNRSPHVNKKARVQYEQRQYGRILSVCYAGTDELYANFMDISGVSIRGVGIQMHVTTIHEWS